LKDILKNVKVLCIPEADHFDIAENLSIDDYLLTKVLI
jgi:hypothetical protein